jgi:hypothetical protein
MKSSPLLRFLSILILLLGACSQAPSGSSSGPSSVPPPPRSEAEPDILEAAFRYQFENNESAIRQNARRYCLTLTGKEPSAEFLRRFEGHQPPVVAAGGCDRASGKDLFFRAAIVEWENDSTAIVRGGYYEGNLSSSREELRVVWEDGEWVVKDKRLEMIS